MSELKRTFVATLVHELKNPVTSIKAHSELLGSLVAGSESGLRSVRALQRAGDQFERTVRDLLLFARYDDASVALDLAPVRLGEVLAESVELFVAEAESQGVSLVADVSLGEDVVEADRTAMERLVNNLVGNAVKYTDAGGVVSVVLRESDQGDWSTRGLALEVADTGIGISEDDLAHLFREFYRSSDPSARSRPGTGLGLAVVQRIVQRHGGQIEVASEVGHGTTVTVLLPVPVSDGGSPELSGGAGGPAAIA
nr:HAMP domain-containing sensor histidine kinase [Nocardioides marinus]